MVTPPRVVALTLALASLIASTLDAQNPSRAIREARRPVPGAYIVVLAADDDPDAVALESAAMHRGRIKHVYRAAIRGFSMRMTAASAAALARDPRVAYVEEDGVIAADLSESPAPWALDRIDQRALPLDGSYTYPGAVRPVHVHVLDTGIRASHLEFGGRAFVAGDFVDDDNDGDPNDVGNDDGQPSLADGDDCHGHGTHVAGTIAGVTYGVVKHASLFSYRVLDCDGYGTVSSVIAGVDAVAADSYRPAVANMSLGGDASEALDSAVRRAVASGITFVVAAGNAAVDASTQSPARVAEAITVGATSASDVKPTFSNFGAVVDLFAPGVSIESAWNTSDGASAILSGTSMAAPHVTGVAALYLEQLPTATPAAVRDALVNAATPGVVGYAGAGSPNLLLYSRIVATPPPPPPSGVPLPWVTADVGSVGAVGRASFASGMFGVDGAGADIWNASDAFRYVYQPLSGDGTIVARVASVQSVAAWTKAAVMIRESLSAGAANATMLVSPGKGLSFQRRTATGGTTVATLAAGAAPAWIKLTRTGTAIAAYRSADGAAWGLVGTATIAMTRDVLIGIAVSSHVYGQLATAAFTDVAVSTPAPAPVATTTFESGDIGAVGVAGSTLANGDGSYVVAGAGADVWGNADAFRYMYRQVDGDWDLETRVTGLQAAHAWTKGGVMIRESLQPGSRHAFALVSAAKGVAFQYRATTGGASAQAGIVSGSAPYAVKLSRRGTVISAFAKADSAAAWQAIGSATIAMGPSIYIGLAVTSHDATRATAVTFDGFRTTQR